MSWNGSLQVQPGEMAPKEADGGSDGERRIMALAVTGQDGLSAERECLAGRGKRLAVDLIRGGGMGDPAENGWNVTIGGHVREPANPNVGASLYVNVVCVPPPAVVESDIAAANAA